MLTIILIHFVLGVVGRKAFQAAVEDFEKNTCIRFIKHTNEKAYIWVHRGSGLVTVFIRLTTLGASKFLDLDSGRLFEVGACSRLCAY